MRILLALVLLGAAAACGGDDEGPSDVEPMGQDDAGVFDASTVADATTLDAWTPPSSLDWQPCGDAGTECTTIRVPLDPETLEGEVDLRVTRARASDDALRIGTLFVNPGGPGVPSAQLVEAMVGIQPVLARMFDIVGVDWRGVGESSPLQCIDADTRERARTGMYPNLPKEIGQECIAAADPELLSRMSTREAAHDLDFVRMALGETDMSFYGASYGGKLGATYATLFPLRVRAFVLDSTASDYTDFREVVREGSIIREAELMRFFEACGAAGSQLSFHAGQGAQAVAAAFDTLYESLSGGRAVGARMLYQNDLSSAASFALTAGAWIGLANALSQLEAGDGTLALTLADNAAGRNEDGSYPPQVEQNLAVLCADYFGPGGITTSEYAAVIDEIESTNPRLPTTDLYLACEGWPSPSRPPVDIAAPGAPPMLLIGGEHDPNTPLDWTLSMLEALDNQSHLFTSDHDGHVALVRGTLRPRNRIRDFLIDPSRMPDNFSCLSTVPPPVQGAEQVDIRFLPQFRPPLTSTQSADFEVVRRADNVVLQSVTAVVGPGAAATPTLSIPTNGEPLDIFLRVRTEGYRTGELFFPRPFTWRESLMINRSVFLLTTEEVSRLYPNVIQTPSSAHLFTRFLDCDSRAIAGAISISPPAGRVYHYQFQNNGCYGFDNRPMSDENCGSALILNVPAGSYSSSYQTGNGLTVAGPELPLHPDTWAELTIQP